MTDYSQMEAGLDMDDLVIELVMRDGRYTRTYSSGDSDALEVLDRLDKDGWNWELSHTKGHPGGHYACALLKPNVIVLAATADTKGLAICRAALMTTEGKDAEDETEQTT